MFVTSHVGTRRNLSGFATNQELRLSPKIESEVARWFPVAKSFARIVVVTLMLLTVSVAVWALAYPSESDPKNIKYVPWKHDRVR
jgi:hypothetical protein